MRWAWAERSLPCWCSELWTDSSLASRWPAERSSQLDEDKSLAAGRPGTASPCQPPASSLKDQRNSFLLPSLSRRFTLWDKLTTKHPAYLYLRNILLTYLLTYFIYEHRYRRIRGTDFGELDNRFLFWGWMTTKHPAYLHLRNIFTYLLTYLFTYFT